MKYRVLFSCGHQAEVELFGKGADRERKIKWFETEGLCPECFKAQKQAEREAEAKTKAESDGYEEVEVSYHDYKNGDFEAKPNSYNAKTKTIIILKPKIWVVGKREIIAKNEAAAIEKIKNEAISKGMSAAEFDEKFKALNLKITRK